MSYDVPVKKYPIGADVDAVAAFLCARQSDSGVTNGGIVASGGSPAVPDLTGNNTSLAYFKGMADALMCGVGFQLESNNALTLSNTSSTTLVDITGSTIAFSPSIARKFTVHCDVSFFFTVAGTAKLRMVVNGDNGPTVNIDTWANNSRQHFHFMHAAPCIAGVNLIKMQWCVVSGTTVLNTTAGDICNYIVSG